MTKAHVANFFKGVQKTVSKHSPEILTGLGIGGMVTATVLAVKATPKALKLIEEKKREERVDELTVVNTVKATWKCYLPATITGATSIACLVGASSVSARRNAALATAYKISETALTEYREKVVETIGEKKEKLIREKVDKERIDKNPVSRNEVIITKSGNTLCYDYYSGRYFNSDIDKINKAVNELGRVMLNHNYVSLNDFYDELELEHIPIGYEVGWNVSDGFLEIDFSSQLTEDGRPCVVLDYVRAPKYGYTSCW